MSDAPELQRRLASSREADVYSALIEIGKTGQRSLEASVASFLGHASATLRGAAARVLGFYWRAPGYRDRIQILVESETDGPARSVEIMAWSAYHTATKDAAALRLLYAIFSNPTLETIVRHSAYLGMMEVFGLAGPGQARALPTGPFDASIDWDLVRRMMDATGVALPTTSTTALAQLGVRKVTYDVGQADGLSATGRIVLTFHGETGLVELVQQRGDQRRAWRADLPAETWTNLIEVMHRGEFPRPAVLIEPPVPGSTSRTISWERRGAVEAVHIAGRSLDYADVNRLAWNVVAQMAPDLLDAPPPAFPNAQIECPRELDDVEPPR
jgi:hypothetical protein